MKPHISFCLVLASLCLVGCTVGHTSLADLARREEAGRSPILTPTEREAVLKGRILAGMSEEMVAASWGVPRQVIGKSGDQEIWEYAPRDDAPFGARLLFTEGVLTHLERPGGSGLLGTAGIGPPASTPLPGRSESGLAARQR